MDTLKSLLKTPTVEAAKVAEAERVETASAVETRQADVAGAAEAGSTKAALAAGVFSHADVTATVETGSVETAVDAGHKVDAAVVTDAEQSVAPVSTGNTGAISSEEVVPKDAATRKREKKQRQRLRKNLEKLNLQGTPLTSSPVKGAEPSENLARKRTLGSTPGSAKPPPKKSRLTGPDYSGAVRKELAVYVGPCAGEDPITPAEFCYVKRILTKRMLECSSKGAFVSVDGCSHYSGRVRVLCSDEQSLNWIREEARKLVPESGPRKRFWVMGPGDLPPTRRCTAWVPVEQAGSKEAILKLLAMGNRNLRVGGLHLTRETQVSKSKSGQEGRVCIFDAELDVAKQLEALQMRPHCGLGRISLQFKSHHPDPALETSMEGAGPSNSGPAKPEASTSGGAGSGAASTE